MTGGSIVRSILCVLSVVSVGLMPLSSGAESQSKASLPADFLSNAAVLDYFDRVTAEHDLDIDQLTELFRPLKPSQSVIDRISRPAERTLEWHEYRRIFLSKKRIDAGKRFAEEQRQWLSRAEAEYGVPADLITAIIGVETYFGRYSGKDDVLEALATLAFHYPRRAAFFERELTEFLLLSSEESINPSLARGSYAGAMGLPQFIASSYRAYAVDFDQDGRRDLWSSIADAIGSVANYFVAHGWRPGEPVTERAYPASTAYKSLVSKKRKPELTTQMLAQVGLQPRRLGTGKMTLMELKQPKITELWIGHHNFFVITQYNHSKLYAMAVRDLALAIGEARKTTSERKKP